jgi:hypothetical protein
MNYSFEGIHIDSLLHELATSKDELRKGELEIGIGDRIHSVYAAMNRAEYQLHSNKIAVEERLAAMKAYLVECVEKYLRSVGEEYFRNELEATYQRATARIKADVFRHLENKQ